jgi:hypothetical protein
MQQVSIQETMARAPEKRYDYYRRCQVFRNGGVQCKAPAEKGTLICHAHARQLALAVRRERERRAVLAKAVAEMRRLGKPECESKDLFMDFKGIQVTVAVMAQALIDGRIDCKTAGRLVVQLQTFSKLLWMVHRKGDKESQVSPKISVDGQRLSKEKNSTTKGARSNPFSQAQDRSGQTTEHEVAILEMSGKNWASEHAGMRITFMPKMVAFADIRGRSHGPPGWARAA